jgi:sugar O-acyltransferase (sialic acid O-acetyltransferase NeuD family)
MAEDHPQVVLFGASEHARVVADIARCAGCEVVAVVDDDRDKSVLAGLPIVHDVAQALRRHEAARWCVGIGDNQTRQQVVERLLAMQPNLTFINLTHPRAVIADDAQVAEGTVIMAGAVVNPGSRIGRHCIVNTGACIDHDNVLEDFSSVAPGVVTGGNVRIGRASAVCIGACVRHGVAIGSNTVVGAGAVVLRDLPPSCVAYGVPCQVVRQRSAGEPYL